MALSTMRAWDCVEEEARGEGQEWGKNIYVRDRMRVCACAHLFGQGDGVRGKGRKRGTRMQ
jgi:hypothetical protein